MVCVSDPGAPPHLWAADSLRPPKAPGPRGDITPHLYLSAKASQSNPVLHQQTGLSKCSTKTWSSMLTHVHAQVDSPT